MVWSFVCLVVDPHFGKHLQAGFDSDGGVYWHYMLVHLLVTMAMTYLGVLFAAAFPNVESAQVSGSLM